MFETLALKCCAVKLREPTLHTRLSNRELAEDGAKRLGEFHEPGFCILSEQQSGLWKLCGDLQSLQFVIAK